jgi:hypothetical protein
MQAYLGGQSVTAEIALIDTDGDLIVASAASYRVIDQAEAVLVASTPVVGFAAGDANALVIVPGISNVLTTGVARQLRIIELILTTDEGTVKLSHEYFIEAEQMLTEGVNSFQNYATALLGAYDIPGIPGWQNSTKPERITALIQARLNMAPIRFRYAFDSLQNVVEPSFGVSDITGLTQTEYLALPVEFRVCLRRAQILEADFILGGDPSDEIRRAGITTKRVGESSETYKIRKALELPVCRKAILTLAKYTTNRVRIGRAGGPITDGGITGYQ